MYWLLILGGVGLLASVFIPSGKFALDDYLSQQNRHSHETLTLSQQAINMASLSDQNFVQVVLQRWVNVQRQLGNKANAKIVLFTVFVALSSAMINQSMLRLPWFAVQPTALVLAWLWGYLWLQQRQRKQFEQSFPDALNMLTSSISAGESVGRGISYVGKKLQGEVGNEFKLMGERLKLGEPIDEVFRKSCRRFPYPAFYFFVITLRANMQRGGQLKEVMTRLNRQMFEARSMEKKKYAMTSEARMSSKIVCAMPFFFLFILQFLSPENFEFVMFTPQGRPILYYLVLSESIGMTIIWALMRGVK